MLILKITPERLNFLYWYINKKNDTVEQKIYKLNNIEIFFIINNLTFKYNKIIIKNINLYNKTFNYLYSITEYDLLINDIKITTGIKNADNILLSIYNDIYDLKGVYAKILFNIMFEKILTFYLMDLSPIETIVYNKLKNNDVRNLKAYTDDTNTKISIVYSEETPILKLVDIKGFDINTLEFTF